MMAATYSSDDEDFKEKISYTYEQNRQIETLKREIKKATATYNREIKRATDRFNKAKHLAYEKADDEKALYPGKIIESDLRDIEKRVNEAVGAAQAEYNKEEISAKKNEIKRIKELKLRLKAFGIHSGGSKVRKSISKKTKKTSTKRRNTKRRTKKKKRKYSKR